MSSQSVHQFAEKVALISDAASRIGRAAAMQLALNGSFVIGLFPGENGKNDNTVNELVELGTVAHAVNADPSTLAGANVAAAAVERLFGRLDLLVNCLKFKPQSSFENVTESDFLDTVAKNLGSVHFLTRAVFGLMKDRPKPKIVNIVSAGDEAANPLFAASQAGVIGMTRALAAAFPANFRINCVEVKESNNGITAEEDELFQPNSSVAPDDVARTVLFLLSSEAIGINGQVIKLH